MPCIKIPSSSSCSYKTAREVLSCSDSPDKSSADIMENNVGERIQEVRKLLTAVSAGRDYNLYFVQSVSDDVHWVCMLSPHTQKIQSLIHNSERRQMSREDLQRIQVGDKVIARWSDFCLYRGRIEKIISSDKFRVRFLDFGNVDSVTGAALYFYNQDLDSIPYQAFTCFFSDKKRKKKKFFDKWKMHVRLCYIDSLDWDQTPNAQIHFVSPAPTAEVTEYKDCDESFRKPENIFDKLYCSPDKTSYVNQWLQKLEIKDVENVTDDVERGLNENPNAHTSLSYSAPAFRNTKSIHNSSSSRSTIDVKEITNNINSNSIIKNYSPFNINNNINININISNDMKMNEHMKPLDSNNPNSGNIWISTSSYSSSTTNSMNVRTCKPIQPIEKRKPVFLESAISQLRSNTIYLSVNLFEDTGSFCSTDATRSHEAQIIENELRLAELEMEPGVDLQDLVLGSSWAWRGQSTLSWVRVELLELEEEQEEVLVKLIDTGSFSYVKFDELRWLPAGSASQLPGLGFSCHLAQVQRVPASQQHLQDIRDICQGVLQGYIVDFDDERDSIGLNLFSENVEINRLVCDLNLAVKNQTLNNIEDIEELGEIEDTKLDEDTNSTMNLTDWKAMEEDFDSPMNNYTTPDDDVAFTIDRFKVKQEPCSKFLLYGKCSLDEFCAHSHTDPTLVPRQVEMVRQASCGINEIRSSGLIRIKILNVISFETLFVACESAEDDFIGEFSPEIISEEISLNNQLLDRQLELYPGSGQVYGFKDPEFGWCRVQIQEPGETESFVSVYLLDHGICRDINPRFLRDISPSVANLPFLARNCSLLYMGPSKDSEWMERAKRYLRGLACDSTVSLYIKIDPNVRMVENGVHLYIRRFGVKQVEDVSEILDKL